MTKTGSRNILILLIIANLVCCKQAYLPPVAKSNLGYLVVDGIIISGQDSTVISLSRTQNIADTIYTINPEPGALVSVIGQNGESFPLAEQTSGRYVTDHLDLNNNETYQLKIITANGNQYLSDSIPVKQTPLIDSVFWTEDSIGVSIYLNTHDPTNNTRYYRWDYTETWDYHASAQSIADWINNQIVLRDSTNQIYTCYSSVNSTNILIGNSSKLSEDVISRYLLTTIPAGSEKINDKYTILVNQYAITADEYDYLQTTKSFTEQLGGLFDPQPSQINGNIHSLSNPTEPVIGFVNASSVSTVRIYISSREIDPAWGYIPYYSTDYSSCHDTLITYDLLNIFLPPTGPRYFVYIGHSTIHPELYILVSAYCGDCRLHGGSNIKPSFWQ
jgi:hypothetical protein